MKILQKDREYLERKADEAMELRRELTKLVKYTRAMHIESKLETCTNITKLGYTEIFLSRYDQDAI